jgi:hypothetical protein
MKGTAQAAALRQSFFVSADRAAFLFLTAMQGVGFFLSSLRKYNVSFP